MISLPVDPRGSRTDAPRERSRTAGLRRGFLLLAIALTVMAGPLGRPTSDSTMSDEVFRPVAVATSIPAGTAR